MSKKTVGAIFIVIVAFFAIMFSIDMDNAATKAPYKEVSTFVPESVPAEESKDTVRKIDYTTFKELDFDKEQIEIMFEGRKCELTLPVYTKDNRYFLPFTELVDKVGGIYEADEDKISVEINSKSTVIDTKNNSYLKSGKEYKLKKDVSVSGEIVYLSMFDITNILDLKAVWDYENKRISLFFNRDEIIQEEASDAEKAALIRIEDVVASTNYRYGSSETLEKLRVISDFLYSKNIPFHIAWVPRYIDPRPESADDNDPANMYSFYNSDFVYTMDYMISRGAIVGLHGYTHQYGKSASVDGVEFGLSKGEQYVEDRLSKAMDSAKKLDIPFSFFEAPHYQISSADLKIVEKYFDYVYQRYPGIYSSMKKITRDDRIIKYIPTPLDYLDGKGVLGNMLSKINNWSPNVLASFFYHPNIEFADIEIVSDSTGYHNYNYSEQSALHQIVKAFEDKGYKFISIQDLQ